MNVTTTPHDIIVKTLKKFITDSMRDLDMNYTDLSNTYGFDKSTISKILAKKPELVKIETLFKYIIRMDSTITITGHVINRPHMTCSKTYAYLSSDFKKWMGNMGRDQMRLMGFTPRKAEEEFGIIKDSLQNTFSPDPERSSFMKMVNIFKHFDLDFTVHVKHNVTGNTLSTPEQFIKVRQAEIILTESEGASITPSKKRYEHTWLDFVSNEDISAMCRGQRTTSQGETIKAFL